MARHRNLLLLAALPLATLLVACQGGSPTEPSSATLGSSSIAKASLATVDDHGSGGGDDDNSGSGGGSDDGSTSGGGGSDDGADHDTGDDNGGAGEVGDDRGGNASGSVDDNAPRNGADEAQHHRNRRNRGRGRGANANPANPANPPRPGARGVEIEGRVTAVAGNALTIAGRQVIVGAGTTFSPRGDLTTLAQVASAVDAGRRVRAEARGARQGDGSLLAQTIKVEID